MKRRKIFKFLSLGLLALLLLPLLLVALLYLPPVQRWAVGVATEKLEESTGLRVSIDQVSLSPLLDVELGGLLALDAQGDTIAQAKSLILDIPFAPLLSGRADVERFALHEARVNTKEWVPDVRVRGSFLLFSAAAHGADWKEERLRINHVLLDGAKLDVALADTAQKDTTITPVNWRIHLARATLRRSDLHLSMPGDTMHVATHLGQAELHGGRFDLGKKHYAFERLALEKSTATMNMSSRPLPNEALFDVRDARLLVERLSYDAQGRLRCRVSHVSLREQQRSFRLASLGGLVDMDKQGVRLEGWKLRTPSSSLQADAQVEWEALTPHKGGSMRLELGGQLSPEELLQLAKTQLPPADYLQLQSTMGILPKDKMGVRLALVGNVDNLALRAASLSLPGMLDMTVRGHVKEALEAQREGQLAFEMKAHDLSRLATLIPPAHRSTIALPRTLAASGNVQFHTDDYQLQLSLRQAAGAIHARAAVNARTQTYSLHTRLEQFPLAHFLKGQPLTPFTGELSATGRGFDPTALRANLVAKADIQRLSYDRFPLGGIQLAARMRGGDAVVDFKAKNPLVVGKGQVVAHLQRGYAATLDFDLDKLDVRRLMESQDTLVFGAKFRMNLQANATMTRLGAEGKLSRIRFITPLRGLMARDIDFALASAPDSTHAKLQAGDLDLLFSAAGDVSSLGERGSKLGKLVAYQLEQLNIEQDVLREALPDARLHLQAGTDNPLASLLHHYKYSLGSLQVDLTSHPTTGLNGGVYAGRFQSGGMLIDTLFSTVKQDEAGLRWRATVRNDRRTNPQPFTATLNSSLMHNGVSAELTFADKEGDVGLNLGVRAQLAGMGVNISFFPEQPIIAYRRFDINPDNYIFLERDESIHAYINLLADDGTALQVYTEDNDTAKNDITFSVKHLNLGELSNVLPYLPKFGGRLNGDFHIIDDHVRLTAMGTIEANDFSYEGISMGRMGGELVYLPKSDKEHYAHLFVTADDKEVAECSGSYFNEGEGSFEGTAKLQGLPLALLNGFLEGTQTALRGTADGQLDIKGTASAPAMNGQLDLNEAHLYSKTYGVDFALDERPVAFENSRLLLQNYTLRSTGDNALTLNGYVDMSRPSEMKMDLAMNAKNFALINTPRLTESAVFGKLYSDFDATIRGTMEQLVVRGNLSILPKTDITYVLTNSPLTVEDDLSQLVSFVNFADTLQTEKTAPTPTLGLDVALGVRLQPGARYHCFLSHNGESYVDVAGDGNLALRMTPLGEMRLTGRLDIAEGKMNYELPVIPLRTFTLEEGSYVEFTGPVMNPKLNISARDRIKTIVTENERQRVVLFQAGVDITRTLEDMGLDFVIEAPEDLSLQNKLAAMSPEQRGKAAVALLATGMYVTDDNLSANGLKASSALNAFLQKEIQSLAGRALSTIDLSFGLENGTSSAGNTTVDYSFQFSKRFLNDRMRVIIGGKVSTGGDVQGNAQSFIDNIALEYRLDQESSRYIRVFYDREAHDPLEGTLMKAGAGLALRRKSHTLGELFLFRRKKRIEETPLLHEDH